MTCEDVQTFRIHTKKMIIHLGTFEVSYSRDDIYYRFMTLLKALNSKIVLKGK